MRKGRVIAHLSRSRRLKSSANESKSSTAIALTMRSLGGLTMPSKAAVAAVQRRQIQSSSMHRRQAWPAILLYLLGAALALGLSAQGRAAEGNTFIIAADAGYGVEDCLAEAGECGRVVADAWCEAHGHGAAISFGRADDVTGAIANGDPRISETPYVVHCGD